MREMSMIKIIIVNGKVMERIEPIKGSVPIRVETLQTDETNETNETKGGYM